MNPKRLIISTTITAFLLLPALRAAETKSPPINPALLYWQAAAQLPKLSDQQAAELREMASGKLPADSAKIASFGFGPAEGFLRKAAVSPAPCDWGLVREDGPAMAMPHLSKIREMANLAVARGDALLRDGKTAEGLDSLLMAHRMARHAGVGETLISYLVQAAIETSALQAAARHCLAWDEATRRGYAGKLQALPPLHSLLEAYQGELLLADWIDGLARLGETERFEKARAVLAVSEGDSKSPADQKAEGEKLHAAMKTETLRKEMEAFRGFHQRAEAAMGKPWKEGNSELAAIDDEIQRSDLFIVKMSFPATRACLDKQAALATRRTMLDVALQHGAQLNDALAATAHDAFEGQPLHLKKAADGTLSLVPAAPPTKGKEIELKLGK